MAARDNTDSCLEIFAQNTQVICSLREVSAPKARRLCVETFFTSNNLIVALTNAESASATVPQGEYIIDWIVTKP